MHWFVFLDPVKLWIRIRSEDLRIVTVYLQDQRHTEIAHDPFSIVLRKEYFDCPQRDSHVVHYILKRGEREVRTFSCTL